jgi:hypothetical protein
MKRCTNAENRKVEPEMQTLKAHLIALIATGIAAALLLAALPAQAAPRVATMNKSCNSIQNALIQNGAAILRYPSKRNPSLTIYDRYVGDSRFCAKGEIGKWASVPAKDTKNCRVIACERFDPDDFFPFQPHHRTYFRIVLSN